MVRHLECRYGRGYTIISMIETARESIQENRIVKSRPKNEITSLLAKLDDERKVESLRLQERLNINPIRPGGAQRPGWPNSQLPIRNLLSNDAQTW